MSRRRLGLSAGPPARRPFGPPQGVCVGGDLEEGADEVAGGGGGDGVGELDGLGEEALVGGLGVVRVEGREPRLPPP